jgi:hypothetical protein
LSITDPLDELNDPEFDRIKGLYTKQYGFSVPVRLESNDSASSARKLLKAVTQAIATLIMRHWLADPRTYDIDIDVTLTPKVSTTEQDTP